MTNNKIKNNKVSKLKSINSKIYKKYAKSEYLYDLRHGGNYNLDMKKLNETTK